jgi:hypothetical protein
MGIMQSLLRWTVLSLAVLALAASLGMLIGNPKVTIPDGSLAAAVSAAPLLLAGIAFVMVQPIMRPGLMELIKNLLLAATFLLWGAIQFLPDNAFAKTLENLVIALYVLDLAWITLKSVILIKQD